MVPVANRPDRTPSRSALTRSSLAPRVPGRMASRRSRWRSRLTELSREITHELNHADGSFAVSVVDMTQTLEARNTTDRIKIYNVSPELYDAMMTLSTA